MFCLRLSTLRLSQRLPSTLTSLTSVHKQDFYCDRKEEWRRTIIYHGGFGDRKRLFSSDKSGSTKKFDPDFYLFRIRCSLKEIKMSELKKAPTPMFWYGMAGLIPFWAAPLSAIIFGYSPSLALGQLAYGATISSFLGGVRWGMAVPEEKRRDVEPSWKALGFSVLPQLAAWLSLCVPQPLGFLMLMGTVFVNGLADFTATFFPPWFRALRLVLTMSALVALFLMWIMRILH